MAGSEKRFTSGASKSQRDIIRRELDLFVERMTRETGLPGEAVVLELRYYHQSATNPFRTNASQRDKRQSYEHHGGRCQHCADPAPWNEVVFHHEVRGVPGQHGPGNLKPYHDRCHDEHHGAKRASLAKGTPRHSA